MIRVCPKRDFICPHGMDCPYTVDRYTCKPEPDELQRIAEQNQDDFVEPYPEPVNRQS